MNRRWTRNGAPIVIRRAAAGCRSKYLRPRCSLPRISRVPPMKIRSPSAPRAPLLTRLVETALLTIVFAALIAPARGASLAPDGVGLTIGDGNNVTIYGVATHWDSLCTCSALKDLGFDTRLVAQLAYWHGRE